MKKKNVFYLILIALLFVSYPVHSQIKLGFQIGPNFANVNIANLSLESKTYLFGGILAEIKISDRLYIQPEINFLQKGYFTKPNSFGLQVDHTYNYYEIPINVLSKFDVNNFTFFIFAGPSLSFLSKAEIIAKHYASYDRYDFTESFEKTDFSINFGGGAESPLSNNIDLFIMVRYSLGLTNVFIDDINNSKIYNRGIALAVGLKFSI